MTEKSLFFRYSLQAVGLDADWLRIDAESGDVITSKKLDYEQARYITVGFSLDFSFSDTLLLF